MSFSWSIRLKKKKNYFLKNLTPGFVITFKTERLVLNEFFAYIKRFLKIEKKKNNISFYFECLVISKMFFKTFFKGSWSYLLFSTIMALGLVLNSFFLGCDFDNAKLPH
ncbi:hypothetical protein BpHYR1_054691 [Brachionus plicatilis]|uniref:Uncharacterized protein n=1 Tax=Brachionus plicatilis TaxID=10195 RepID=A0A3M7SJP1_BRAPC|nr:hypothetical protein BpHYR1_054691 [Brachionus plicatilis]